MTRSGSPQAAGAAAAVRQRTGVEAVPCAVAVPVYGTRVLPRFGMARTFWLAESEGGHGVRALGLREWDPTLEPRLPLRLVGQGVGGVLCGGIHPRFQADLEAAGLWVIGGQRGEAGEVAARWARGEMEPPGTAACPSRPCACGWGMHTHRRRGEIP